MAAPDLGFLSCERCKSLRKQLEMEEAHKKVCVEHERQRADLMYKKILELHAFIDELRLPDDIPNKPAKVYFPLVRPRGAGMRSFSPRPARDGELPPELGQVCLPYPVSTSKLLTDQEKQWQDEIQNVGRAKLVPGMEGATDPMAKKWWWDYNA